MKHLKEKGMFSIDSSFDYSSIYELEFSKFKNHPIYFCQINSGMDIWPIPSPSRKWSLKEILSCNKLEYRVSTSESNSFLYLIYMDSSSSSDDHSISSFVPSSLSSKDDYASFPLREKIHGDCSSSSSRNYGISASNSSLSVIKGSTSFTSTYDSIKYSIKNEEETHETSKNNSSDCHSWDSLSFVLE